MSTPKTPTPLLGALEAADMGFRVIPCKPGGKEPAIANWNKLATQDVDKIQDWWEKWPDANPAIVTEGLLVVDYDTPGGSDLMVAENIDLPPTMRIDSPRGHRLVYRAIMPSGTTSKFTNAQGVKVCDFKGNKGGRSTGLILVPGGCNAHGNTYSWGNDLAVAAAPEDLIRITTPKQASTSRQASTSNSTISALVVRKGERHNFLLQQAGTLWCLGGTEAELHGHLAVTNKHRCQPPLPDDEVSGIAKWSANNFAGGWWINPPAKVVSIATALAADPKDIPILLALVSYADRSGSCWPRQQKLAEQTAHTVKYIRTGLKRLESAGLISINRTGQHGKYLNHKYQLLDVSW